MMAPFFLSLVLFLRFTKPTVEIQTLLFQRFYQKDYLAFL